MTERKPIFGDDAPDGKLQMAQPPHDEVGTPDVALERCDCGDVVRLNDQTHAEVCEKYEVFSDE